MTTRLKIAIVTCLLVFILMDANPVLAKKGGGKYKKLADRVKKLEESVGEDDCKPCQLIAETKEETAKLAEAVSALSPALSSIDELKEQLNETREEIEKLKNPPTPTLPPTPAISDAQECRSYTTLTGATRKVSYGMGDAACDRGLTPGWYRFEGAAGTKMATVTPGINHCGTHAPGYLTGGHPTMADGQVTKTICFDWNNNKWMWSSQIAVRNCGPFYVYNLKATPQCRLRYCGSD